MVRLLPCSVDAHVWVILWQCVCVCVFYCTEKAKGNMCIYVCICKFNGKGKLYMFNNLILILPGWDEIVLTGGPATEKEKSGVRKSILYLSRWHMKHSSMSYVNLWFVQRSIPLNSGAQWKKLHMRCGLLINHLNMVQNKLIRAAANGVCGEPVMINRLLDNGSCFALGYEVMSRLCFLKIWHGGQTGSEKVGVFWKNVQV